MFDHVVTLASWYVLRIHVDLEGFSGFEVVDFFLRSLSIWMPTMFFISNRAIVEVLSSVISINTLLVFEPMTHDIVELRKGQRSSRVSTYPKLVHMRRMIIYRAPVPPFPTFSAQQLFQLISVANFTALKMRFLVVGEYYTTIRRAEKGLDPAKRLYSTLDKSGLHCSG